MRMILGCLVLALVVVGVTLGQGTQPGVGSTAPATQAKKPEAITGQCHCGQLKYEVTGTVIKCSYCDCQGCRRATGALKAPFVTVAWKDLKVSGGEAAKFQMSGGKKCDAAGAWYSCPTCRSPLYWKGHKGEEVDLFAGTLDDAKVFVVKP